MYKFNPKNMPYKGVDVKSLPLNYQLAIIDERRRHAQFHRQQILNQRKEQHDAEVAKRREMAIHQRKIWYAKNMIGRGYIETKGQSLDFLKKEVFRKYKNSREALKTYNEFKRMGDYRTAQEFYAEYEGWKLNAERTKRIYNNICDRKHWYESKLY